MYFQSHAERAHVQFEQRFSLILPEPFGITCQIETKPGVIFTVEQIQRICDVLAEAHMRAIPNNLVSATIAIRTPNDPA